MVNVARTVVVSITNWRSTVSEVTAAADDAGAAARPGAAEGAPDAAGGEASLPDWLLLVDAGVGSGGGGKNVWYPKSTRNDRLIASRTLRSMSGS